MKNTYYPQVDKKDLFKKGFIAEKSGHSRGSTLDLTLTRSSEEEIDMGTPFDYFDSLSHTINSQIPQEVQQNRLILKEAMERSHKKMPSYEPRKKSKKMPNPQGQTGYLQIRTLNAWTHCPLPPVGFQRGIFL